MKKQQYQIIKNPDKPKQPSPQRIAICTLADSLAYPFVRYQAQTVRRMGYLNNVFTDYYIMDLGLTNDQVQRLSNFADILDPEPNMFADLPDTELAKPGNTKERAAITRSSLQKAIMVKMLQGCERLIYLDADAFFTNCFDTHDIFNDSWDVCLTLKNIFPGPVNVEDDPNKYRFELINCGVQFYQGNKYIDFIEELLTYTTSNPILSDQGNTNLLLNTCRGLSWMRTGDYTLSCKNSDIVVRLIKCGGNKPSIKYNYFINNKTPKVVINGRLQLRDAPVICHAKGLYKRRGEIKTWRDFGIYMGLGAGIVDGTMDDRR